MDHNRGTAKRDALRANEIQVQKLWEEAKAFESDADLSREHFFVTFPYRKLCFAFPFLALTPMYGFGGGLVIVIVANVVRLGLIVIYAYCACVFPCPQKSRYDHAQSHPSTLLSSILLHIFISLLKWTFAYWTCLFPDQGCFSCTI